MRHFITGLTVLTLLAGCGNDDTLPFGATEPSRALPGGPVQPLVIPPQLTLPPPTGGTLAQR